jgi:hypothetical protein
VLHHTTGHDAPSLADRPCLRQQLAEKLEPFADKLCGKERYSVMLPPGD